MEQKMYVNAEGGLRIRAEPSQDAPAVGLIADRSEVRWSEKTATETMVGLRRAPWYKVEYEGKTGWVFGGFLEDHPPGTLCQKFPEDKAMSLKLRDLTGDVWSAGIDLAADGSGRYAMDGLRMGADVPLTWTKTESGVAAEGRGAASVQCGFNCQGDPNMAACTQRCEADLMQRFGKKETTMLIKFDLRLARTGKVRVAVTVVDDAVISGKEAFQPEMQHTVLNGRELECNTP